MPTPDGAFAVGSVTVRVRAGAVTVPRTVLYILVGLVAAVVCGSVIMLLFGSGRFFTGLVVGVLFGIAVGAWFFTHDGVVLDADGVTVRRPWSHRTIAWEQVRGARFTEYPEVDRWCLSLADKNTPNPADELILVAVPPVTAAVANPYDMRKREQIKELYLLFAVQNVPVSVPAPITDALRTHWQLEPKVY